MSLKNDTYLYIIMIMCGENEENSYNYLRFPFILNSKKCTYIINLILLFLIPVMLLILYKNYYYKKKICFIKYTRPVKSRVNRIAIILICYHFIMCSVRNRKKKFT